MTRSKHCHLTIIAAAVLAAPTALVLAVAGPAAAASPPDAPTGVRATVQVLASVVAWTAPTSTGGSPITSYSLTSSPDARTAMVAGSLRSAVVEGLRPGVAYTFTVRAVNAAGTGPTSAASPSVTPSAPGARYTPLAPTRLASGLTLTAGAVRTVAVAGHGGVPTSGAAAAVLTVHVVTRTGANGALSIIPAGSAATIPALSSAAGATISSLSVVPLGTGGAISVRNSAGTATVAVDVSGWVPAAATGGTAGLLNTVRPTRLLAAKSLGAGGATTVAVLGKGGVPTSGVAGALVRITAATPTTAGSVVAFPAGATTPTADSVRFASTTSGTAQALVKLGAGGIRVLNRTGTTKVSVDVLGWLSAATAPAGGSYLRTITPVRVLDTRTAGPALSAAAPRTLPLAGAAGLPTATASVPPTAAVLVVTALGPSTSATLSAPAGGAADLFLAAAKPASTVVVAPLDSSGAVTVALSAGATQMTVDVLGYYAGAVVTSVRDKVLSDASAAAVTAVSPDGSVTFAPGAPAQVASVGTGDVLVVGVTAETPYGLLRRVTGTTVNGDGSRTLATNEATLADAVLVGAGSTANAVPVGAGAPAAGAVTAAPASVGLAVDEYFPFDKKYGGTTAQLSITGGLQLHAGMDLDVSVHLNPVHPVDAKLTVSASENFNAQADANADLTFTDNRLLGQRTLPTQYFLIGDVPVYVTPVVTANLDLVATAHGEAHASILQSRGYTATVSYVGGNTTSSATPTGAEPGFSGPTGAATAQIKLGVKFTYHYLVYGAAGPFVSGEPYLKVDTDGCAADLSYGLTIAGGVEAKVLGYGIRAEASFDAFEKVLATTGYHCTWTGTVTSEKNGSDGIDTVYRTKMTWTPTLGVQQTSGDNAGWAVEMAGNWTVDYYSKGDNSSGDCIIWVEQTANGAGSYDAGLSNVDLLEWNNPLNPGAYYYTAQLGPVVMTQHEFASGPGPNCPNYDRTSTFPFSYPVNVPVGGPAGAASLSGTYSDMQVPPNVTTWSLTRHLPGS